MALITTPRQLARKAEFYHHLSQLASAGIGLPEALAMHQRGNSNSLFRKNLAQVIQHLESGATLGEALGRIRNWLPAFDLAMLRAGELSGRLPECFSLLARHYEERVKAIRQISSDLMYPLFLLHFAVFIGPLPTLVLTGNIAAYLGQVLGLLAPLYGVALLVIYAAQSRHGEHWRAVIEMIARAIPVVGSAQHHLALARLAAALEALISAGLTIIEAWELAADASGSPALRRAVRAWKPEVLAGMTPAEAVSRNREFPELFVNLYHTGEISGKLDHSLKKLHEIYQEEATRKLRLLTQWLPRLVYLAIVFMIAWRVLSFWLGYFGQLQNVLQ